MPELLLVVVVEQVVVVREQVELISIITIIFILMFTVSYTNTVQTMATSECFFDSDCITTGCSSEICASEEMASACVYVPEYECNQYRSCGCVAGTCAWSSTSEYDGCVENL